MFLFDFTSNTVVINDIRIPKYLSEIDQDLTEANIKEDIYERIQSIYNEVGAKNKGDSSIDFKDYSYKISPQSSNSSFSVSIKDIGFSINNLINEIKQNDLIQKIFNIKLTNINGYMLTIKNSIKIKIRINHGKRYTSKFFNWKQNEIIKDIVDFILESIEPEKLILYYYKIGDYNFVIEKINKIDKNNTNPFYVEYLAMCYDKLGNEKKAIVTLENLISREKSYWSAYFKLGEIYFNKKNYKKAIKYFKQVNNYKNNFSKNYLLLGVSVLLEQYESTLKSMDKLLLLEPQKVVASLQNSFEENLKDAIELFKKALKYDSKNISAYYLLATSYSFLGETNRSIEFLNKVIYYEPNFGYAYYSKGEIYMLSGQIEKSNKNFQISIDKNFQIPMSYLGISKNYFKSGNYNDAILYAKLAIEYDKKFIEGYVNLAYLYLEIEDYQNAMGIFNKLIMLNKYKSYAYSGIGYIYSKSKKYIEAIKYYHLSNKFGNKRDRYHVNNLKSLLQNYGMVNDLTNAIKLFEDFKNELKYYTNEDIAEVYNAYGLCFLSVGNYRYPIKIFKESLLIIEKEETYRYIGISYFLLARYDEALKYFELAIKKNRNFSEAYFDVGNYYFNKADTKNAISNYKKSLNSKQKYFLSYYKLGVISEYLRKYFNTYAYYKAYTTAKESNCYYECVSEKRKKEIKVYISTFEKILYNFFPNFMKNIINFGLKPNVVDNN